MHVDLASFHGSSNIGLFCFANNKFCLIPKAFSDNLAKKVGDVLKVPIIRMNAAGTSLVGVFITGNDETLLVPKIFFESEINVLKENNIKYEIVDSELTALGNNMVISGKTALISEEYSEKVVRSLEKVSFKVKRGKIAEFDTVGSFLAMNSRGGLISNEAKDFEIKFLEKTFERKFIKGTINFGSPYVKSGIVVNDNGFIAGELSGGPEVQNADEAFGFLEV